MTMKGSKIICWWSGGVTSAVACHLAIELYGSDACRIVMIDTKNEHHDTYRFKNDCEAWYGKNIETITYVGRGKKWENIQEVWRHFGSLNVARGAICSSELKRQARIDFQKRNNITYQVFGFDIDEPNRAKNIKKNYATAKPIFPLLLHGLTKKNCIKIVEDAGIELPEAYKLGFHNNNCLQTGCVQGGIGYWQKMRDEHPEKFNKMASIEHELTDEKGQPVTCLKDQSKLAKATGVTNVFLKPHADYPEYKDLSQMKGRPVEPLMECNGFCGINKQLSLL